MKIRTKRTGSVRTLGGFTAAVCVLGALVWSSGGSFGPPATPAAAQDANQPTPVEGLEEDEAGNIILREDEFRTQRAYPGEEIPLGALPAAQAEASQLGVIDEVSLLTESDTVIAVPPPAADGRPENAPPAAILTPAAWSKVGTAGQTSIGQSSIYYNGSPPYSGRIVALANHPTDANIAYIGAAAGGVWKTTNGGTNWTPVFDDQPTQNIGAIAVDPSNPDTVYVGTGESSGAPYYGQGLFKSTNGGTSWTKLPGAQFDYCYIADIVVKPATNTVLVAVSQPNGGPAGACQNGTLSSTGTWTSNDGGNSWVWHAQPGGTSDLAIEPSNPNIVYAGDYADGFIYSTSSGGASSWFFSADIRNIPNRGRVEIAAAGGGVVYAAVASTSSTLIGIYKSTNFGVNWTQISAPTGYCDIFFLGGGAQCGYDFALTVNPANANELYLAGIYLGRSTNGGVTWSYTGNNPFQNTNPLSPAEHQTHVDNQTLSYDAAGNMWVGNDGGVWKTANGVAYTNLNGTLDLQQFQQGISATTTGLFYGGTQDLGSSRYINGPGWVQFQGGDGGATGVDPNNESTVFSTYIWLNTSKSTDGGVNNAEIPGATNPNCLGEGTSNCLFYAPIKVDPFNANRLFLGTRKVFLSSDLGTTAPTAISPNLGSVISAIAPTSSTTTIYAGTAFSGVYVTTNSGGTWTQRNTGLPNRWVKDILVHPTDPNHAWVVFSGFDSGHVYETINAGVSWTNVSGNLPNTPVNAIDGDFRSDPANIYVGTDVGVFATDTNGTTWENYGTGMPNLVVTDLIANTATNNLIAGTGRGMWTSPLGVTGPSTMDFGDAPASYLTLLADDGARHANAGVCLGVCPDLDPDGFPTADAQGDDTNGADDEDGVTFTSPIVVGTTASVDVVGGGFLNAWLDFNGDGDWNDVGEQIFTDVVLAAGVNNLMFPVPAGATVGSTYARFRVADVGGLTSSGFAGTGEVEDYQVAIVLPNDDVAGATALTGATGSAAGSNVGATGEAGEVQLSCVGDSQTNSVWWAWTAPTSGTVVFDTVGSNFDTTLGVYTGTTLPTVGQEVGCNDDTTGFQSEVTLAATQGTDYLIRVDGFNAATGSITLNHNLTGPAAPTWPDFNGDGLADRGVFRPEFGGWYVDGMTTEFLGLAGDVPVPGDYDGDGVTERAVFRNGAWYIEGQATRFLGVGSDRPVPGDYDGDGDWEPAVFRDGAWFIEGQATKFLGVASDVPVPADYDGDGVTEVAVFRPSVGGWYVEGAATVFYGLSSDVPVPADYDGDGSADRAVFRPEFGGWYVDGMATEFIGLSSDVPVPADYTGNGIAERAVFRPEFGGWYVQGAATVFYGLSSDIPLPLPAAVYNTYNMP